MANPDIRESVAPADGLSRSTGASVLVGDLVVIATTGSAKGSVPTHTLQGGYTEIASITAGTGIRLSVAYKVATSAGAVSYQAYTSSGANDITGLRVYKVSTFDLTGMTSNTSSSTADAAPDPSAVTAIAGIVDVIAAWFFATNAGSTVTITEPSGYTKAWEYSGAATLDLSLASKYVSAGSENPGTFSDDSSGVVSASASITINFPAIAAAASTSNNLLLLGVG